MKKVLLYGADDWGEDDEPDTLSPRSKNMNEFKELHNGTILLIGFVCGYLFRSFIYLIHTLCCILHRIYDKFDKKVYLELLLVFLS